MFKHLGLGLRRGRLAAVAGLALLAIAGAAEAGSDAAAQRWWGIVSLLADDGLQGRRAGSPGFDKAADYVAGEFKRIGLQPAGTDGYLQPFDLIEQQFDLARSSASVAVGGKTVPLAIPADVYFRGSHPLPATIDAPLVFAGYGLSIPEAGHDDFADLDLRGKVVVVISGGPQDIAGSRKANARSERTRLLAERGAVGLIALTAPGQVEIPWERQAALATRPSMYLADAPLRGVADAFMSANFSPDSAQQLFTGAEHPFAELAALAEQSKPLPRFALPARFKAKIVATTRTVHSANLVAVLPGSDPKLASEYVVLSAHLDGLGVGAPSDGDAIYNGAFDNAVGVANVITIAEQIARQREAPRRSLLFLVATAEEQGLLGSSYFVQRPTVPRSAMVADINFDMPLPIFKFRTVTPIGYEESSLGDDAARVSKKLGIPIVPDPFPDRNVFIRSDQYSFVRAGIPSLFPKYGFRAGTKEAAVERAWRADIYHSPRDDAQQPVMRAEALRFNAWSAALLQQVANNPERPRWREDSYFARFAD